MSDSMKINSNDLIGRVAQGQIHRKPNVKPEEEFVSDWPADQFIVTTARVKQTDEKSAKKEKVSPEKLNKISTPRNRKQDKLIAVDGKTLRSEDIKFGTGNTNSSVPGNLFIEDPMAAATESAGSTKLSAKREPSSPIRVGLLFPSYSLADRLYKSSVKKHLNRLNDPDEKQKSFDVKEVGKTSSLAEYGKATRKLVEDSDVIVISYEGTEVDTIASFASGLAFGLHKPVIAIRTDTRPAGESEKTNLMLSQTAHKLILPGDASMNEVMRQVQDVVKECRDGYEEAVRHVKDLDDEFIHDKKFDLPFEGMNETVFPKVYPAGGLFTAGERSFDRIFEQLLKNESYFTMWPWRNAIPSDFQLPREEMDKVLTGKCIRGIRCSDMVVANADGSKVDDGTAFEIGYATAVGKPTMLYRTDFRTTEILKKDQEKNRGVFEEIIPVVDVSMQPAVDAYVEPIKTDILAARETFRPLLEKMSAATKPQDPSHFPAIIARFGDPQYNGFNHMNRCNGLEVAVPLPSLDNKPEKLSEFRELLAERLSHVANHYGRGSAPEKKNPLMVGQPLKMDNGKVLEYREALEFGGKQGHDLQVNIFYVNSKGKNWRLVDPGYGETEGIPGHLVITFAGPGYSGDDNTWLTCDRSFLPSSLPDGEEQLMHPSPEELRTWADETKAAIRDLLRSMRNS